MKLLIDHFKLHEAESEVKMTISDEFLKLLQKDGYAKNIQANSPKSSIVKLRQWIAPVNIWNCSAELVYQEEKTEISKKLDSINDKLNWLDFNMRTVLNKICMDLLELKNSTWLEEHETGLTEELFVDNLSLDSIQYYENNDLIISFKENNMFGGHIVQIGIKDNLTLATAEIVG